MHFVCQCGCGCVCVSGCAVWMCLNDHNVIQEGIGGCGDFLGFEIGCKRGVGVIENGASFRWKYIPMHNNMWKAFCLSC